jgi:ankyrin repeat protein
LIYAVNEFEEDVMSDNWINVVEYYKKDKSYHTLKVRGRGTALHVAVSNGMKVAVYALVDIIGRIKDEDYAPKTHPLRMFDERDCTPLHIAAYRGFISMCMCIIGKNGERNNLIWLKNSEGETPPFWAVLGKRTKTFVYLRRFFLEDVNILMDEHGTTILHVAIRREMFG